jgi:hypothetical protein
MYLFARTGLLANGKTREAALWVASITEKVNQITDLNVTVWRNVFSSEVARITWVAAIEELSQLEAADDKLAADDAFVALLDSGATHTVGGVDDRLGQFVHLSGDPERPIEYAATVSALIAPGKFGRGVELGVDIAQRAEKITGTSTSFLTSVTGDYAGIQWLTAYDNIQAMQAANEKLQQDASFLELLDKETVGVYESGLSVTQQTIYRKVL